MVGAVLFFNVLFWLFEFAFFIQYLDTGENALYSLALAPVVPFCVMYGLGRTQLDPIKLSVIFSVTFAFNFYVLHVAPLIPLIFLGMVLGYLLSNLEEFENQDLQAVRSFWEN